MTRLLAFVKAVIDDEDSPLCFERLCVELYRAAEGVDFLPTAKTWGRDRDARGISTKCGRPLPAELCATLAADLDEKVAADIRGLVETTNTECIIYCSFRPLTEQSCDKIETIICRLFPSVRAVRIVVQSRLVALIERCEEPSSATMPRSYKTSRPRCSVRLCLSRNKSVFVSR